MFYINYQHVTLEPLLNPKRNEIIYGEAKYSKFCIQYRWSWCIDCIVVHLASMRPGQFLRLYCAILMSTSIDWMYVNVLSWCSRNGGKNPHTFTLWMFASIILKFCNFGVQIFDGSESVHSFHSIFELVGTFTFVHVHILDARGRARQNGKWPP